MPWTLEQLLDDPTAAGRLRTYMEAHLGMDNVNFWLAVRQFRRNPTEAAARDIIERFVTADSPLQVNLSDELRDILIREVTEPGYTPRATDFDLAYRRTQSMQQYMGGLAQREFYQSDEGRQYARDHSGKLDEILDDPRVATGDFYAFARAYDGTPTRAIDFLLACRAYRNGLDRKRAQAIYDAYLRQDAPLSLGLPDVDRAEIERALAAPRLRPEIFAAEERDAKRSLDGLVARYVQRLAGRVDPTPEDRARIGAEAAEEQQLQRAHWGEFADQIAAAQAAAGGGDGIAPPPDEPGLPALEPGERDRLPGDEQREGDGGEGDDGDREREPGRYEIRGEK
jgi:hypothetical protein